MSEPFGRTMPLIPVSQITTELPVKVIPVGFLIIGTIIAIYAGREK